MNAVNVIMEELGSDQWAKAMAVTLAANTLNSCIITIRDARDNPSPNNLARAREAVKSMRYTLQKIEVDEALLARARKQLR